MRDLLPCPRTLSKSRQTKRYAEERHTERSEERSIAAREKATYSLTESFAVSGAVQSRIMVEMERGSRVTIPGCHHEESLTVRNCVGDTLPHAPGNAVNMLTPTSPQACEEGMLGILHL